MASSNPYIQSPSGEALRNFLHIFGREKDVRQEIGEYLRDEGTFKSPTEIFAHMMDKRVASGAIAPEQAGVLRASFSHTFIPESGTGYLPKHREPLVMGLAQLYADEAKSSVPVFQIEGDISNLGGLNKALIEATTELHDKDAQEFGRLLKAYNVRADNDAPENLGRAMADRVLQKICSMTHERLQKIAEVIPVRKGGDEISFFGIPKPGVDEAGLKADLRKSMKEIADFVRNAGLRQVPHPKYDNENTDEKRLRAGVGLGLHAIDMRTLSLEKRKQVLEQGIADSKLEYQTELQRDSKKDEKIFPVDLTLLAQSLHDIPTRQKPHTVIPNLNAIGEKIPEFQQRDNLENILSKDDTVTLTKAQTEALVKTHASMIKNDPVTDLPMFEYMQEEHLPYFQNKYRNVKMMLVDFNLVGAGNKLTEEVGNAAVQTYKYALMSAMKHAGLENYYDGIGIKPGGKFVVLLPGDTPNEKLQQFRKELQPRLDRIAEKPLPLSKEMLTEIRKTIAKKPELQDLYCPAGERLFDQNGQIPLANLISSKKLPGPRAVMVASDVDINPYRPLEDQLRTLQKTADKMHEQIIYERGEAGEVIPSSKASSIPGSRNGPETGRQ